MSFSPGQDRLLPAYVVLKHQQNSSHGILEVRDFLTRTNFSLEGGDSERYEIGTYPFPLRAANVKLRWIALENNFPETLRHIASVLSTASSLKPGDNLETLFFKPSSLRFGLFQYSQAYAESCCEVMIPEIGYSPSESAKLDPQLAIRMPFFKWAPTSHTLTESYPRLRDYAQPSAFHSPSEHEKDKFGTQRALPIVVHQLWLFVTKSDTIVSFHPKSAAQADARLDVDLDAAIMTDIPGVTSKDAIERDLLEDAYVMAAYVVRQTCLLQISGPAVETPMIPFLEQKVAQLSGKRIDAYTSFSESIAGYEGSQQSSQGRHTEIELLLEIIMNIEELESFLFVLESQTNVLSQIQGAYTEMGKERPFSLAAHALLSRTMGDLSRITANVKRLVKNATQIQAAVRHLFQLDMRMGTHLMKGDQMVQLLDLKQKEANLLETQYARQRAEEAAIQTRQTAQQGRTILLFTVTTIMFLPLSFFTSYFGMNVQEITGDSQNTTQAMFWSVCAPITITVVTLAVILAFNESVRGFIQRYRSERT